MREPVSRDQAGDRLGHVAVNFSQPFITRPIGTILMAIGLMLAGLVAYRSLPVASLPSIEVPMVVVSASRPGADPATMAATVAAPLERHLGSIAGVTDMTSSSGLGSTRIRLQFDLNRSVDDAARDVQAAINAAVADLPGDLPSLPVFRKINPNASPVLILALTSDNVPVANIYDIADTTLVQRIAQVPGVGEVNVSGAEQPALRIRVNPRQLAAMGVSVDEVRRAVANATQLAALGSIDGPEELIAIDTNAQLKGVEDYKSLVVKMVGDVPVRLSAVADVVQATRNARSAALFNQKPAVLIFITKQPDANVIETVDQVKAAIPELKRWIDAGIRIDVLSDRTVTIRASVHDMELTLLLSIALVMLVVLVFLKRTAPMVAAGVTVPLSLAGTVGAMWLAGYSINNLTLMALAISVGFVVDDAIVMIENMYRNLEKGLSPMAAALVGAREIGFTVVSISLSLAAAFVPLVFLGGVPGRLLREFAMTMLFAIAVSTVVSLSVTPMLCAHTVREAAGIPRSWAGRLMERLLQGLADSYAASLETALRYKWLTLLTLPAVIAATVFLFVKLPKGFFPTDDTGLISVFMQGAPDASFGQMKEIQERAVRIALAEPAVSGIGSSVGASFFATTGNTARMFIALKPLAERGVTSAEVAARLRRPLNAIPGLSAFVNPVQDMRGGGGQSRSSNELALWSTDAAALYEWAPRILARLRTLPGLVDVATDREQGGLELSINIDKLSAARLGVQIEDIGAALNNAFAQRQVAILYGPRNQYRVVLEVDPALQRSPEDLASIYVPTRSGQQIPLLSVVRTSRTLAPLAVNHQGTFPAVTISYNLEEGITLDEAHRRVLAAVAEMQPPDHLRIEPAGDARTALAGGAGQPLLILAALLLVYIVLGVLYESLAHPLTIISTLPSAGLGALVALRLADMELSLVAFIAIILLIGIVKKNGIMLVDFALEAERRGGLSALEAIRRAARERFRPILMTTLAALFGAVPLAIAAGHGAEMRRPLGVAIIGGLVISQILTLYTTPVIYLLLDRVHRAVGGRSRETAAEPPPSNDSPGVAA
ncbi:MAG: efflux RND transporter permease subunit [Hyphomicrobiaceae bacterium]|nr:efflux RND transporter permease subunit [Hyphomicrobiaceae bacterium]